MGEETKMWWKGGEEIVTYGGVLAAGSTGMARTLDQAAGWFKQREY